MKKKLLTLLFLLSLSAGIFYACLDEIDPFGDSGRNNGSLPSDIVAIKAWYDNEAARGYIPWHVGNERGGLSERGGLLVPNWRRALSNENPEYSVTEVQLRNAQNIVQTSSEAGQRFKQTGDSRYLASDMRLVVRTHKGTGEIR